MLHRHALTRRPAIRPILAALALVWLAIWTSEAKAQLDPGRLTGTLVDEQGNPVEGVRLRLVPEERGASQPKEIKVNKKGRFTVAFLPSGRWKVETQDSSQFLKSMHYTHRNAQGLKIDELEANGHPTTGLPAFNVGMGAHAHLDLVLGAAGAREQLAKRIRLQEVAGPLKRVVKLYEEGDMRAVVTEVDKILEESPGLEQALYMRGSAQWQLQRYAEAESDLRAALAADPELPQIHGLLGTTLLERARKLEAEGKEAEARPLYDEAAGLLAEEQRRSPDDPSVRLNLIVALDEAGRREELEPALVALIDSDPTNLQAAMRLADLYAADERYDDALALIDRLGLEGRGMANILYNVAVGHYNAGETEAALATARKVLEASPDHVEVHRLIGYLQLSAGDRAAALASLRKFVELAGQAETPQEQELIRALEQEGS